MKIYLQEKRTNRFYAGTGSWCESLERAIVFPNTVSALKRVRIDRLENVSILISFGERSLDVVLPIGTTPAIESDNFPQAAQ